MMRTYKLTLNDEPLARYNTLQAAVNHALDLADLFGSADGIKINSKPLNHYIDE